MPAHTAPPRTGSSAAPRRSGHRRSTRRLRARGQAPGRGAGRDGDDGRGRCQPGDVHEALNFAGIHHLPMVLVVENNGYAISVPVEKQVAVHDVAIRPPATTCRA